ncbi:MAG: hypothetical protein CM1200mP26_09850 [Acidimicrobiales bacterium]|nr:MAG: hypothetical protein CM1200mP26_09850 [Acidimicrobiales bacterium]
MQSLIIPEEHGGQGFGFVELGVVLEGEKGRALLCAPFFSTGVLAANTLIHAGDEAAASGPAARDRFRRDHCHVGIHRGGWSLG